MASFVRFFLPKGWGLCYKMILCGRLDSMAFCRYATNIICSTVNIYIYFACFFSYLYRMFVMYGECMWMHIAVSVWVVGIGPTNQNFSSYLPSSRLFKYFGDVWAYVARYSKKKFLKNNPARSSGRPMADFTFHKSQCWYLFDWSSFDYFLLFRSASGRDASMCKSYQALWLSSWPHLWEEHKKSKLLWIRISTI